MFALDSTERRIRGRLHDINGHQHSEHQQRARLDALEDWRRLVADRALAEAQDELGQLSPEDERAVRAHLADFTADLEDNMLRWARGDS